VSRLPGASRLSPVLGALLICMPPFYSTIGGFGDKWIYITGTFVGGPDKRPSSRPDVDAGFRASLDMPTKEGQAFLDVPPSSPTSPGSGSGSVTPLPQREDGRIVHCISVSQYCASRARATRGSLSLRSIALT
jgi:hypothetical protein